MEPNDIIEDLPEEVLPVEESPEESTDEIPDQEIQEEDLSVFAVAEPVDYSETLALVNANLTTIHSDLNILTGVILLVVAFVFARMISNKLTGGK